MVGSTGHRATSLTVAQLNIIGAAFAAGIVLFAAIALTVGPLGLAAEDGGTESSDSLGTMLLYVLGAQAIVVLPISFALRNAGVKRVAADRESTLAQIDEGQVPTQLGGAIIVSAALVESLGLFGCVIVLLTGNMIALGAPVLAVLMILLELPNQQRLREAVESAGRLR